MNDMPLTLREKCADDPAYKTCMRSVALHDHECKADPLTGRLIEWEHALTYAGKALQVKFAIISTCWWAHRGAGLNKEINVWLALNQANDEELRAYSKAIDLVQKREYLNQKWGYPVENPLNEVGTMCGKAVHNVGINYPWLS